MKAILLLASLVVALVGSPTVGSAVGAETRVIRLADGRHTEPIDIVGDGTTRVIIVGNEKNPKEVIVDVKGAPAIRVRKATVTVSGVELRTTEFHSQLLAEDGGIIEFSNVRFSFGGRQVTALERGHIRATGNYSIVVGGQTHLFAVRGGTIEIARGTVVTMENPVFLACFAAAHMYGVINIAPGVKFDGNASTTKFHVQNFGRIDSGDLGVEGLPGAWRGLVETGGEYR